MTDVLVDLVVATVGGATAPARGTIYAAATSRRRDGSHVIIAQEFGAVLVNGVATLTMPAGTYRFREDIPAGGGVTQVLAVPDSASPVNYGDLSNA